VEKKKYTRGNRLPYNERLEQKPLKKPPKIKDKTKRELTQAYTIDNTQAYPCVNPEAHTLKQHPNTKKVTNTNCPNPPRRPPALLPSKQ
jgi:hypothetical protein